MAIDNLQNSNDQNPLSGPYIRSIVKQLTKQPNLNTTHKNLFLNNNDTLILPNYPNIPMTSTSKTNTTTTTRKQAMARPSHQRDHAQGHKKQVRRRLHTSRPYQERLLNMAEARKEIVTALKYHRASMKQANDRKQAQQNDRQQVLGRDYYESSRKVESEHLSVDNYGNCYPSDFNNNNNNHNHNYNQNYCSASNTSTSPTNEPTSILYESLHNIPLPNQTLGLNLNLQSFTNLDTKLCHRINTTSTITTTTTNNNNSNNYPTSITTSPSPSPSSSSSSLSNLSGVTATMTGAEGVGLTSGNNNMISGMDMHPTLDQEEIAKMRSIGEQYQIEWDDTLNLVKSARWFKFLKTADYGKEMKESYYNNGYDNLPFGELMEIPPWLSPINDDDSFLQQHLDDSCSDDTTLPWMDIGDIDAMDDEWLSKDSAV